MTVEESIKRLGRRFNEKPMNFTVEASLVAELQNILRDMVGEQIKVEGRYKFDKGGKWDFTNYKEGYLEHICQEQEISNVQMEVNIGRPGFNDHRVDLAILSDGLGKKKVDVVNGSKYFPKDALEVAVEMKYIKNRNVPPKPLEDADGDWADFDEDVEKLKSLPESTDKYILVFSNKNIFQTPDIDDKSSNKSHRRLEGMRNVSEDIKILQFYPGKEIG